MLTDKEVPDLTYMEDVDELVAKQVPTWVATYSETAPEQSGAFLFN
jgi:hypothetical protein